MATEQETTPEAGDARVAVPLDEALAAAVAHHQAGRTDFAETVYRDVLAAVPGQPDALQFLGVLLHGRGESREGAAMLREAARRAPENAGIWTNLGNVLLGSGETEAAIEAYRRAMELAPADPAPRNNLGTVHKARGELAEAEAAYRAALALDAGFADAWHNLAVLMLATRRFREAVDCALRSAGASPEAQFPEKLQELANAPRRQKTAAIFRAWLAKDPSDTIEAEYRTKIQFDAAYARAWYDVALILLAAERFNEAATCSLLAASLDPAYRHTLRFAGLAHALQGRNEHAAAVFRAWLAKEPDNPVALHYLAACEGSGAPDRASDAFVERTFDDFATSFDEKLASLDYRAPGLIAAAVRSACGADAKGLRILDAGCGTGLSGREVKDMAASLTGVDLSKQMLIQASRTGLYDALEQAELTAYLASHPAAFDIVLSADTLCYFGALEAVAEAAFAALAPSGVLAFSVEAMEEEASDYRLQSNGRYAHAGAYVDRALAAAGLDVIARTSSVLRTEGRRPVNGWIVTARRPPASA
jgi:predicted TPR repeat methyltransferase